MRADAVQGVPVLHRPAARQRARHVPGHRVQPLREQGEHVRNSLNYICLCIFVIYVPLRLCFCQMGVWSQASFSQTINTFNHRYRNGKIKN